MSRTLCQAENLFDFFHEQVGAVVSSAGGPVSEDGVYYLSNLLVERSRVRDGPAADTLVELRMQAEEQGGLRAVPTWRELGDKALYESGFFRASLQRRTVSVDYYLSMGASAYDRLSALLRLPGAGGGLDEVYAELATRFDVCSEVLQSVRDALRAHTHSDILRLYEEWIATSNPRAAERLRELGVVPMRPGDDDGSPC
jgi:hypothetical protein